MIEKLRMATATLRRPESQSSPHPDLTPDACLAVVRRLYARLQTLPTADQPGCDRGRSGSLAYQAIQHQIRWYAERYVALVEAEVEALTGV